MNAKLAQFLERPGQETMFFSPHLLRMDEKDSAALEIGGLKLKPDLTKGYVEFRIAHAWPSRTDYGTSMHPAVIANSYQSLLHQVFNIEHKMKSNGRDDGEEGNPPRDRVVGSVVAIEFPQAPMSGWKLGTDLEAAPYIRAAAVIHKRAEGVRQILGEHLSGHHKWAVSKEMNFSLRDSGFLLERVEKAKKKTGELIERCTPADVKAAGLGYIPCVVSEDEGGNGEPELAPLELVECYNFKTRAIEKDFEGMRVTLMKGGMNGAAHFFGVGWVRYGAEYEAQIQSVLANNPHGEYGPLMRYFRELKENGEKLLTELTKTVQPRKQEGGL